MFETWEVLPYWLYLVSGLATDDQILTSKLTRELAERHLVGLTDTTMLYTFTCPTTYGHPLPRSTISPGA